MKWVIALLILLLGTAFFITLQIKGVIVLPASPERCSKLKSASSESQIAENQEYWNKRCGHYTGER